MNEQAKTSCVFIVRGEPQGKGRPRFTTIAGHARAITPDKTVFYENLIKTEYTAHCGNFCFPANVPLKMCITARYSIPASASKKKREQMMNGKIRPTKKPDWDNVGKVVSDALNGIAYYDDAQIVSAHVAKYYDNEPSVVVLIAEDLE